MSDAEKTVSSTHSWSKGPLLRMQKPEAPPESPTTAKALDFDDETTEATSSPLKPTPSSGTAQPSSGEDLAPPPKPPRPLSSEQQAENTLKEAFPSIDAAVVKAVLRASGGRVEPAFNALLGRLIRSTCGVIDLLIVCRHVGSRCCRATSTSAAPKASPGPVRPYFYRRRTASGG